MRKRRMIKGVLSGVLSLGIALGGITPFAEKSETVITAYADDFENSISGFPDSYKPYLRALHSSHASWKFEPLNTGLDFETVVDNELDPTTSGSGNKSLVSKSAGNLLKRNLACDYNASTGTYIYKDSSSWVSASRTTVSWFVDPRNFLNEVNIFQFEKNVYDANVHTYEGVKSILGNSFMKDQGVVYTYVNTAGKTVKADTVYPNEFYVAGITYNVSPYYLAAKSLQEMGSNGSGSCSGTYSSTYTGIYNFFNIGASDGTDPVANGLKYASSGSTYNRPWTSPQKAIVGGAMYYAEKYINQNQYTGYLTRFNVMNASNRYKHQYMTNISGAAQETSSLYNAYKDSGSLETAKVFLIPVYQNMPSASGSVTITGASTKGTLSASTVLRSGPGVSYSKIATLDAETSLTILSGKRADTGYSYNNLKYPYWYQVKVSVNGAEQTGYVWSENVGLNASRVLAVGQTEKLPATASTSSDRIYYHSDNPGVISVDDSGNVICNSMGTANVYAFLGNGSMACVAYTTSGMTISEKKVSVDIKTTHQLTCYSSEVGTTFTWSSSDSKVAKVDANGLVTAKRIGRATITATASDGGQLTCQVNVVPKPSGLKVSSVTYNKIGLSWERSGYSRGYVIYRKEADGAYKRIAVIKNKNTLTYTDTSVTNGRTYTYQVKAYKKVDGSNYYSSGKEATKKAAISKITDLKRSVSQKKNRVTLCWSKVSGASGYAIYRKTAGGSYKRIARVKRTVDKYYDKKLAAGKYYYRVRAYKTTNKNRVYGYLSSTKKATIK